MIRLSEQDAAYVFISGQSNAHAHGQALEASERITEGLCNVYALDRRDNQSFDNDRVRWSHFTTEGKNLGETQDHTASFAYFLAKRWQRAIDDGAELPDLYIVQISIGGQGIVNREYGLWSKHLSRTLVPGVLGVANISLYSFATHIHTLVAEDMKRHRAPVVLGWHWLGSEQDAVANTHLCEDFGELYDDFFDHMLGLSPLSAPTYLYRLHADAALQTEGMARVNAQLERQCTRHEGFRLVDVAEAPFFAYNGADNGIFANDNIHYTAKTQAWFANTFFDSLHIL